MESYQIGYDLNERCCQISYFDSKRDEPETLEAGVDYYKIPLIIGKYGDNFMYGNEAKHYAQVEKDATVDNLLQLALKDKHVYLKGEDYKAEWLLTKFVELTLQSFKKIEYLVFTVPTITMQMRSLLYRIATGIGLDREQVRLKEYRECFCHYMFFQPKDLWQYESALFYGDRTSIEAYLLRKLNKESQKRKELFVTVDSTAQTEMEEMASVYPVLNVDKAKHADDLFYDFIKKAFGKRVISSVFLTGEGFENNWYPNSLRLLCNGRRAFLGSNLYSKGACYAAYERANPQLEIPIYLDETKMTEQVSLKMRIQGVEEWVPIIPYGTCWYEGDRSWEVLLENNQNIELHIENLDTGDWRVETVSFAGLPSRTNYALRLRIEIMFINETTYRITFTDVGFGDFFKATNFVTEVELKMQGGNYGESDSVSS